jgi:cytochrome-b5 reductase
MNFILVGFLLLAVTYYFYHYGRIKTLKNRLWHDMKDIETFLRNRKTKYKVKLVEKIAVTHDTFRYRFSLGDRTLRLGLPVGKCLKVFGANIAHAQKAKEWNPRPETERNGNVVPYDPRPHQNDDMTKDGECKKGIERKYTPCTLDSDVGFFEFTIKTYRANVSKIFPNGGKFSQYMESLSVGDMLQIQGPFGRIEYLGRSQWKGSGKQYGARNEIGLIAGGSGVTPMLQLIQAVLSDPQDTTKISLLYANKTMEDIIVKEQLDQWSANSNGQFTVHYTLDVPPPIWDGFTGFINDDMISKTLPEPSKNALILMCGPPPMIKFACLPNLEKLQYDMKNGIGEF